VGIVKMQTEINLFLLQSTDVSQQSPVISRQSAIVSSQWVIVSHEQPVTYLIKHCLPVVKGIIFSSTIDFALY